jgi:hypothetical protein
MMDIPIINYVPPIMHIFLGFADLLLIFERTLLAADFHLAHNCHLQGFLFVRITVAVVDSLQRPTFERSRSRQDQRNR